MVRSVLALMVCLGLSVQAVTLTVTTNAAIGAGSLKDAISTANASSPPNTINFNIAGSTIIPVDALNPLPNVINAMTIDGTTQPGYSNGYPRIWLQNSAGSPATIGLNVLSSNVVMRGLKMTGFTLEAVQFLGVSNRVEACQIVSNNCGVLLNSASYCTVGGSVSSNGCAISGSTARGIYVLHGHHNTIAGNLIGVNPTNSAIRMPNAGGGILVEASWSNQIVKSDVPQVISGNGDYGIRIFDVAAVGNVIKGNYIGLDSSGMVGVTNATQGIYIQYAPGTLIGGTNHNTDCNVISGNGGDAIAVNGAWTATNVVIQGNWIGLTSMGSAGPRNGGNGMFLSTVSGILVGGTNPGAGNIISGNNGSGLDVEQLDGGIVQGNVIGLNSTASAAVSNTYAGLDMAQSFAVQIGGTNPLARNTIGGNGSEGIYIFANSRSNIVEGNLIGLDGNNVARPNGGAGIYLDNAISSPYGNRIGGTNALSRNIISGNLLSGISLSSCGPNQVWGNYIGLNAAGAALANGSYGVSLASCVGLVIGGSAPGQGNVISGNVGTGVLVDNASASNQILGNIVGLEPTGAIRAPNGGSGIYAGGSGTLVSNNVVSGNGSDGITVMGDGCCLVGNVVGLSSNGMNVVSNGNCGISVQGNRTVVGGGDAASRNVVAGNTSYGIPVTSTNNVIRGNYIDVGATGTNYFPNGLYGLYIEGGCSNTVGGAGAGNVIGSVRLTMGADGNNLQGNYLAVDTRDLAITGVTGAVMMDNSTGNTLGGEAPGEGNQIGGMNIAVLLNTANANIIQGNNIGLRTNGAPLAAFASSSYGISLVLSTNNLIGSTNAAAGNHIVGYGTGIAIASGSTNAIMGNSIWSNQIMSIDLGADKILNPNDVGDGDTGANGLQNYPVITNVMSLAGSTWVRGFLSSAPNRSYRIEFFENDQPTNAAQRYLGYTVIGRTGSLNTNGFNAILFSSSRTGRYVTATATRASVETSEVGPCLVATVAPDTDHDGMPDFWESQYGLNPNVSNTAASDADADGMSDYAEYIAGTLPNDSNSCLRITAYDDQNGATLSFPTCYQRVYDLYYLTNSLTSNNWVVVQGGITGNGDPVTVQYRGTNALGFYRIGVRIP